MAINGLLTIDLKELAMTEKKKHIALRWFVTTFGIVAALMLAAMAGVYFTAKSYYYNSVRSYLSYYANTASEILVKLYSASPSNYANEVRTAVEYFEMKNIMEFMAVDADGRVQISSSGFSNFSDDIQIEMPDYDYAMSHESGIGQYIGVLNTNKAKEKYMAISVRIPSGNSEYSALRVVTSLEKIDSRLFKLILISVSVSMFILFLILIMGLQFLTSILTPIKEITKSAQKLAKGDFSKRIKIKKNDEIGELCRVFNNMVDELCDSERIKNDFISSVSHELRTPLTAIIGWSETITRLNNPEILAKGMRVITTETQRLSSLVEELLDFSRIQNNRLVLQRTNTDIFAELADAVIICTQRADKLGIIINYSEPDGVAMIYGDKNRLRQVFLNILDNAIKYTGADGIISVEAYLKNDSVEIKISDNGCGISKEDLPKVKTRFYKANHAVQGSGIGLAIADELISLHGGTLDIESVLGEGTTVIIKIPTTMLSKS